MDYHGGVREPRFSLIIPAYNEAGYLPRLLETVEAARAAYRGGGDSIEVIVADNESTDATAQVARQQGCVVEAVAERRIAAVRNGGAAVANGDVLAFVDADMRIHPETFNAIEVSLATGKVVAGATGVRLERWSLGIAATYAVMVPWVWVLKMDTGVVFCLVDRLSCHRRLRRATLLRGGRPAAGRPQASRASAGPKVGPGAFRQGSGLDAQVRPLW